jgi:hypothetical protein
LSLDSQPSLKVSLREDADMRHNPHIDHVKVDQVKDEIFDIFMSIEVEEHEQRKKSEALKQLEARRGIEKHFEKKRLVEELDDYCGDDDVNH